MSKRFTDTEKWRKGFIKGLQTPYKLLWLYILDECDHAGIWHVEIDIAAMRLGEEVTQDGAIKELGKHITPFDNGEKWFIPAFIDFQYGELKDSNIHKSVIKQLKKYGLYEGFTNPLGSNKDKAKDKDKKKEKKKDSYTKAFEAFWQPYPNKASGKGEAYKSYQKAVKKVSSEEIQRGLEKHLGCHKWLEDNGKFVPHATTWLNQGRWDAEIAEPRHQTTIPMEKLTAAEQLQRRNDEALRRAMEE